MSKFFVGQRVRILWSKGWPELAGEEGVVVGVAKDRGIYGVSEWVVSPCCWGTANAPREGKGGGCHFAPSSDQLEPILPEGAAPSVYTFQQLMDSLQGAKA